MQDHRKRLRPQLLVRRPTCEVFLWVGALRRSKMTDVAMGVSDIELNDVPDMRQDPNETIDAPLVAPGPCYATHLDVSAAQTRARDTVDAVARVARAAAPPRPICGPRGSSRSTYSRTPA